MVKFLNVFIYSWRPKTFIGNYVVLHRCSKSPETFKCKNLSVKFPCVFKCKKFLSLYSSNVWKPFCKRLQDCIGASSVSQTLICEELHSGNYWAFVIVICTNRKKHENFTTTCSWLSEQVHSHRCINYKIFLVWLLNSKLWSRKIPGTLGCEASCKVGKTQ